MFAKCGSFFVPPGKDTSIIVELLRRNGGKVTKKWKPECNMLVTKEQLASAKPNPRLFSVDFVLESVERGALQPLSNFDQGALLTAGAGAGAGTGAGAGDAPNRSFSVGAGAGARAGISCAGAGTGAGLGAGARGGTGGGGP